ncbi:MAG TPA: glycosyltransferase [Gemmatimonadales bacterium]|nr:glycosyltransferase [Gemmatimonadales bacterium]
MTGTVVHVASGREWRGGQRQVWLLARELQRLGEVAQTVVTGSGSELALRLGADAVPVVPATWHAGLDPRALAAVIRAARRGAALLHAHDAHAVTLAGIASAVTRVPFVATRRVDFPLRRRGLWARACRIIAISEAVATVLTNDGIPSDRLVVVHSGIDLDAARAAAPFGLRARLGLAEDTPVAVTVGALVPHKDHATLLHSARRLADRHPALHWAIAGDGELLSVLEWLRDQLGLNDRVHFLGRIPEPEGLIAEADVFVMSSREEGLGTSVLDAMARGIPVASTSAGGLGEMLGGGAGLLVPAGNPEALAGAVGRILADESLRAALATRGMEAVRHFTAERMAGEVLTVYRSCVPQL